MSELYQLLYAEKRVLDFLITTVLETLENNQKLFILRQDGTKIIVSKRSGIRVFVANTDNNTKESKTIKSVSVLNYYGKKERGLSLHSCYKCGNIVDVNLASPYSLYEVDDNGTICIDCDVNNPFYLELNVEVCTEHFGILSKKVYVEFIVDENQSYSGNIKELLLCVYISLLNPKSIHVDEENEKFTVESTGKYGKIILSEVSLIPKPTEITLSTKVSSSK